MAEPALSDVCDENAGVCMLCDSRREAESPAVKSATRKVAMLTAVCSVLCVLTISACCCSLYLYTRFQGFRQELVDLVRMDSDTADDLLADYFTTDHNAMPMYGDPLDDEDDRDLLSENTIQIRHRRKNENNRGPKQQKCRKKQRKACNCCKQALSRYIGKKIEEKTAKIREEVSRLRPKTPSIQSDPAADNEKISYVSAAHYTTYVDENFINEKFGNLKHDFQRHRPQNEHEGSQKGSESDEEMHLDVREWQAAPLTLRFFKEADWMKNSTTVKIFDFDESTGKFKVKQTGLYHLYAHVLFYDVKTRMAIGLMHESKKGVPRDSKVVFRCMESVDYVNPKLTVGNNSKYKSCNVNGVLYLNEGDNIAMQSLYKNTCLDLTYDATYFGGIFFSTPNTNTLS